MHPAWQALIKALGDAAFYPIWSLDGTSIHTAAIIDQKWVKERPPGSYTAAQIPTYSGDLHKPIEHSHGTVSRALAKYMAECPAQHLPKSIDGWFSHVKDIFYHHVTKEGVQRDISSLKETYHKVLECKGDYPPKQYR